MFCSFLWPAPGLSRGATSQATIGSAPAVFPHFAQGGGYQTTFAFNSLSPTPSAITLEFFSQEGRLIGSAAIPIAGFGSARHAMTGSSLAVGWARASTNPAIEIAAAETIQLFNPNGGLIMEASVPGAQPDVTLRLPVYEKEGFSTGIAFVNLTPAATTVTMTVRNPNGVSVGSAAIPLNPSEQVSRFVSQLFPAINNFEGTLELTAPRSIAALALRQSFASGIFSTLPVSPQPVETFFSPRAGIASRIVQEINRSESAIDAAIYSFTRNEIADALIAAKNRGVQVRIIADTSQVATAGGEIPRLQAAGLQVKLASGPFGGIMHHKYAIFDGRLLLTGSYNWSTSAEESSDENAVFIRNASVVAAFQSNFNSMWSR